MFEPINCNCGLLQAPYPPPRCEMFDPNMHHVACACFAQPSSPRPREATPKKKSAKKQKKKQLCWVWPHDSPRQPTMLHRIADILTGRGPDQYVCVRGHKPKKKKKKKKKEKEKNTSNWVNRDGKHYNPLSRQYEHPMGFSPMPYPVPMPFPMQMPMPMPPPMPMQAPWAWEEESYYDDDGDWF